MRGTRQLGAAVGMAALAMSTMAACRPPGWPPEAPGGGQVQTAAFDTPGVHTSTVPAGVRYATFDVYGAEGGGGEPGQGAHVRATIPVTKGQTITLIVGGEGGDPSGQTAGAGGSGGGAPGGTGGDHLPFPADHAGDGGGGGGGGSDVRSGPADDTGLATRIIVAGGGGGAAGVAGGDGGLDGLAGADGSVVFDPQAFPVQVVPGGVPGAGAAGSGAAGEDGRDATVEIVAGRPVGTFEGDAGGGGGGGLAGGGGGQATTSGGFGITRYAGTASGGAGGSSLVPADDLCPTVIEDGVRAGDGQIVVTFRRGAAPSRACL